MTSRSRNLSGFPGLLMKKQKKFCWKTSVKIPVRKRRLWFVRLKLNQKPLLIKKPKNWLPNRFNVAPPTMWLNKPLRWSTCQMTRWRAESSVGRVGISAPWKPSPGLIWLLMTPRKPLFFLVLIRFVGKWPDCLWKNWLLMVESILPGLRRWSKNRKRKSTTISKRSANKLVLIPAFMACTLKLSGFWDGLNTVPAMVKMY